MAIGTELSVNYSLSQFHREKHDAGTSEFSGYFESEQRECVLHSSRGGGGITLHLCSLEISLNGGAGASVRAFLKMVPSCTRSDYS